MKTESDEIKELTEKVKEAFENNLKKFCDEPESIVIPEYMLEYQLQRALKGKEKYYREIKRRILY